MGHTPRTLDLSVVRESALTAMASSLPRPDWPAPAENSPDVVALLERLLTSRGIAPHAVAGYVQLGSDLNRAEAWGVAAVDGSWERAFDLASISKSFLSVLLSHMVDRGPIEWAWRLKRLAPELTGTWAGEQTLEALLCHRAGLQAHIELFRPSWAGAPIDRLQLLRRAANSRKPGKGPLYSDLGYILVGHGLVRHFGIELDELLRQSLASAWNLEVGSARQWLRSSQDWPRKVAPTEIQPGRGGVLRGQVHDDNAWALDGLGWTGHAGLFGTLESTLRFGARCLEELGAGRMSELVVPRPGGSLRMGFDSPSGASSTAGRLAGARSFGHLGFTGTSFWCDPDRRRVTVLLCNRVFPSRVPPLARAIRTEIHDFLWSC